MHKNAQKAQIDTLLVLRTALAARDPGELLVHSIDAVAVTAGEAVCLDEAQQHLQGMVLQGLHDH